MPFSTSLRNLFDGPEVSVDQDPRTSVAIGQLFGAQQDPKLAFIDGLLKRATSDRDAGYLSSLFGGAGLPVPRSGGLSDVLLGRQAPPLDALKTYAALKENDNQAALRDAQIGYYNNRANTSSSGTGIYAFNPLTGENELVDQVPKGSIVRNRMTLEDYGVKNQYDRGSFVKSKRAASTKFGADLERLSAKFPERRVSLRGAIDELNIDLNDSPKLRSIVNRVPKLKQYLAKPELADDLSLAESQDLLNDINSKIPVSKFSGNNIRPDDFPVIDLTDNIKGSQAEVFPELPEVKQAYGQVLNDYRLIKGKIKPGSLSENIKKNFGDVELQNAVKRLLPQETLKQLQSYKNIKNVAGGLKSGAKQSLKLAPYGAGGLALYELIFGKRN